MDKVLEKLHEGGAAEERAKVAAYLRACAANWRAREAWSTACEMVADELDEAARGVEAGEHAYPPAPPA